MIFTLLVFGLVFGVMLWGLYETFRLAIVGRGRLTTAAALLASCSVLTVMLVGMWNAS